MSGTLGNELAVLDEVQRMLAEAKSVHEVKDLRDKMEALRTYVKDARLGLELQNRVAEAKLRAERKAGEMLALMNKAAGARGTGKKVELHDATPLLCDLGIEKTQSHRWQRLAGVSDEDFEAYLRDAQKIGREITAAGLLRSEGRDGATKGRRRGEGELDSGRETATPAEFLEECGNHCRQLVSLLQPVYGDPPDVLPKADRRQVAHLLTELALYVDTLQQREIEGSLGNRRPKSK